MIDSTEALNWINDKISLAFKLEKVFLKRFAKYPDAEDLIFLYISSGQILYKVGYEYNYILDCKRSKLEHVASIDEFLMWCDEVGETI